MKFILTMMLMTALGLANTGTSKAEADYSYVVGIFNKYNVAETSKSNKGWVRLLRNEHKIINKFGSKLAKNELNHLKTYFTAKLQNRVSQVGVLK